MHWTVEMTQTRVITSSTTTARPPTFVRLTARTARWVRAWPPQRPPKRLNAALTPPQPPLVPGHSPGTVANRVAGLQTEQRRVQREIDGYSRRISGYVDVHAPATGARREQLQSRLGELDDQIRYWTEVRVEQLATGQATGYSADTVRLGDLVIIRSRVRRVVRTNKATVTVRTDHSWDDRVPWHEIRARITEVSVPDPDAEPGGGMPI